MAKDRPDDSLKAEYDVTDVSFKMLIQGVVLGTYTIFNYDPTEQECKMLFARLRKKRVADLENVNLEEADMREMRARLITAESRLINTQRFCKGDASETGLVQFCGSIMDLDETRAEFPTHIFKNSANKETEAIIPFNSDWKFNLFIRDLNKSNRNPATADDNLCVYMKGAPERMISRCSKIVMAGKEVELTETLRQEVNEANTKFGDLGERVLAFARCKLDPKDFPKDSYQFDVKAWKEWGYEKNRKFADYSSQPGAFPMHDLTLVGLVSLNDPPRFRVDISVNKCRSAGIKVIMVTGDQPATAAAIANKVNIIKHPKKEFNYMVKKLNMSKE